MRNRGGGGMTESQRRKRNRLVRPRNQDDEFFDSDLKAILGRLADPDWPPKPLLYGSKSLSELRRIPFAPLRRMAERIGIRNLRRIFDLSEPKGENFFRLIVRLRLDVEFTTYNRFKANDDRHQTILFGNKVLQEFRRQKARGLRRNVGKAQESAARVVGLKAGTPRSFQREYRKFCIICREEGRVPSPLEAIGLPPEFDLEDL